jgi:hypothetical protein
MSLSLGSMTAYVEQNASELIKEAVLKGRTVDLVTVQGGIKSAQTINRISTALTAAAGACGWNAAGTTTLDQRTITVDDIKINESICLNDLEAYYTQVNMNPGSYNTEIPFEQIFAENKRDQIMALVEDMVWKGDKDAGSGNLALTNGLVKLFDAGVTASSGRFVTYSSAALSGAGSGGAYSPTSSNIYELVDELARLVNVNVIDAEDLHVFVSYADYRTYAKILREKNYFAYTGAENQGQEFSQVHPGTNIRVIAVRGLNNASRIVLAEASNIYVGTDLLSDAEDFKVFYSQDNDEVRFLAKWKLGVQVAFIENVVYARGF